MIKPDFSLILAVYMLLVLFGVLYNFLIAHFERKGYLEGYVSLAVAGGAAFTLAMTALVDWRAALLATGAFVASGLPMILGSIWRHIQAREQEQKDVRQSQAVAEQRQGSQGPGG